MIDPSLPSTEGRTVVKPQLFAALLRLLCEHRPMSSLILEYITAALRSPMLTDAVDALQQLCGAIRTVKHAPELTLVMLELLPSALGRLSLVDVDAENSTPPTPSTTSSSCSSSSSPSSCEPISVSSSSSSSSSPSSSFSSSRRVQCTTVDLQPLDAVRERALDTALNALHMVVALLLDGLLGSLEQSLTAEDASDVMHTQEESSALRYARSARKLLFGTLAPRSGEQLCALLADKRLRALALVDAHRNSSFWSQAGSNLRSAYHEQQTRSLVALPYQSIYQICVASSPGERLPRIYKTPPLMLLSLFVEYVVCFVF
jgi:hypothetical protein